jgi:2,5-diamino-6-(ribosylamino)-4(3H)-pyrimidinone 5'-phosphate reductase
LPERTRRAAALRLYPPPARKVGGVGIYGDLALPPPASSSRPYVVINMVASVDGRSSRSGKASGIGGEADRRAMRELRSKVDAVMVGAGTLRAERLNLGLDDPVVEQPLALILCGCGHLPLAERLVESPQEALLVMSDNSPGPRGAVPARAKVLRVPSPSPGRVDLRALLWALRSEHAVKRLLVEGGPTVNRALIDEGLVDELFVTVAPKLLSGEESAILAGGSTTDEPENLTLLSVRASGDELFLRYRLDQSP